jgi:hypothetical protein
MAGNTQAIEAVLKLQKPADQPPALKRLIQREGLEPEIPERSSTQAIQKRLERAGLLDAAKDWMKAFTADARICLANRSIATAREIAWRYVEAKAQASGDAWLSAVFIEQKAGEKDPAAASLPADTLWVYRHPLLAAVTASPALERSGRQYETIHPCPSNGARSRLNSARQDAKSIEAFMRYVDKLLAAATMPKGGGKTAGAVEIAEEEAIADLEIQLLQEMEAKLAEFSAEGSDEDEEDEDDEEE